MGLVRLALRYTSPSEKNPDANSIWVNTDHIVSMTRKLDGWGQNLETIITLVGVKDTVSVLAHPDEIMKAGGAR